MSENDQNLLPLSELSEIFGYTQPHLAYLCRTGEIAGQKQGRSWMATFEAVEEYTKRTEELQRERWTEMSRNQSLSQAVVPTEEPKNERTLAEKVAFSRPSVHSFIRSMSWHQIISGGLFVAFESMAGATRILIIAPLRGFLFLTHHAVRSVVAFAPIGALLIGLVLVFSVVKFEGPEAVSFATPRISKSQLVRDYVASGLGSTTQDKPRQDSPRDFQAAVAGASTQAQTPLSLWARIKARVGNYFADTRAALAALLRSRNTGEYVAIVQQVPQKNTGQNQYVAIVQQVPQKNTGQVQVVREIVLRDVIEKGIPGPVGPIGPRGEKGEMGEKGAQGQATAPSGVPPTAGTGSPSYGGGPSYTVNPIPISYVAPQATVGGTAASFKYLSAQTARVDDALYVGSDTVQTTITGNSISTGSLSLTSGLNLASATTTDTFTVGANFLGQLSLTQGQANRTGLALRAAASPTANLFELQNASGAFLTGFTGAGGLLMNISSTTALTLQNGSGTNVFVVPTNSATATTTLNTGFIADTTDNTLVVNANENRVGISTLTPSTTLGVVGTARFNGAVTVAGALTVNTITGSTQCLQADTNGLISGSSTSCGTSGSAGGWQNIFAGQATLTPTSTSAGIYVLASSTIDSTLRVTGAFSAVSGTATSTFAHSLVADTDTLVVNANENRVGIGTASPTTTLGVLGTTRLNGAVTVAGALTVNTITGSTQCLQVDTNGLISGSSTSCGTSGTPGAWQNIFAGQATLSPTSTTAGIYVLGSSTIDNTLRVTGAFSAVSGSATSTMAHSLVVDTTTLVVNAAENRVGIGTASPLAHLHVYSTGETEARIETNNNAQDAQIRFANADGSGFLYQESVNGGSNLILRPISGKHLVLIDSGTGNVGIGDTSPASLFTVGSGDLFQVNSLGQIMASSSSIVGQNFFTASTSSLTSGDVMKLVINSSGFTGNIFNVLTDAGTAIFQMPDGTTATTTLNTGLNIDGGTFVVNANENRVGIGTASPSTTLGVVGTTRLNGAVTVAGGLTVNTITGSTQCLQVDTNGLLVGAGGACSSSGVGSPGAWQNAFAGQATLAPTSTTAGIYVLASSTIDSTLRVTGALSAVSTSASSTVAHSLVVDTTTLVVNANENRVGIGTASPVEMLTVQGNVQFLNSSGQQVARWAYESSLLGLSNYFRIRIGGESDPTGFAITDHDTAVRMWIDRATGNVGIGLINPTSTLTVLGSFAIAPGGSGVDSFKIAQTGQLTASSTVVGQNFFTASTSSLTSGDVFKIVLNSSGFTGNIFNVLTDAGTAIFQMPDGTTATTTLNTGLNLDTNTLVVNANENRVGIGTASPVATLHVSGGGLRMDDAQPITFGDPGEGIKESGNHMHYFGRGNLRFYTDTDNSGAEGYEFYGNVAEGTTSGAILTIQDSGNVGIATTTPPQTLTVVGSVCIDDTAGAACGSRTIASGAVEADGTITSNAFDLAEIYASVESLEGGDVVAPDGMGEFLPRVRRTQTGYSRALGIVSADPAFLMGWSRVESDVNVALAGRVPVKVTDENGPIKAGDMLVAAPTPGHAMRWDPNDPSPLIPLPSAQGGERVVSVIGVALEDFNPDGGDESAEVIGLPRGDNAKAGKILVFVNLEHQRLSVQASELGELITIDRDLSPTLPSPGEGGGARLKFNADAIFAYKLAAESGQWELDQEGKLIVKKLEVEEIKVLGTGQDATIGSFKITPGLDGIEIKNNRVMPNSKIFLSPRSNLEGRSWYIASINTGDSFTVKLSSSLLFDAVFDYWIVQSDDERIFGGEQGNNANTANGGDANDANKEEVIGTATSTDSTIPIESPTTTIEIIEATPVETPTSTPSTSPLAL